MTAPQTVRGRQVRCGVVQPLDRMKSRLLLPGVEVAPASVQSRQHRLAVLAKDIRVNAGEVIMFLSKSTE